MGVLQGGERVKQRGSGADQPRPAGSRPPCHACPKKSPREAHRYELNMKNIRAVQLYYRTRAMCGRNLSDREAGDPVLARNMAIIDQIVRHHER
jgi:hypothetical protein